MSELLDRIFGRKSKKSGTMAKERLQFVLVHDRINLPPERMEAMKKEILAVISKYVSVDQDNVDIALQNRDRASLLVAEIPFLKALEGVDPDENDDLPTRAKPAIIENDLPARAKPTTSASADESEDLPARAKSSTDANTEETNDLPARAKPATNESTSGSKSRRASRASKANKASSTTDSTADSSAE